MTYDELAADIGEVLRQHTHTTGMAVAMGSTCRCGYWSGNEEPGRNRPVGYSGLDWHRAQVVADFIRSGNNALA